MTANKRWGIVPRCSLFLSLGSVEVQKRASITSWPKAENSLSPTSKIIVIKLKIKSLIFINADTKYGMKYIQLYFTIYNRIWTQKTNL